MDLLLDTHALLWFLAGDSKLSATAQTEIAAAKNVFVSIASLWEIGIKVRTGKLSMPSPLGTFLERELHHNNLLLRSIEIAHVDKIAELPLHHRDPFDRMLAAQAIVEGLTLVSTDSVFDTYGVPRRW